MGLGSFSSIPAGFSWPYPMLAAPCGVKITENNAAYYFGREMVPSGVGAYSRVS
jgi:hypothetical protein